MALGVYNGKLPPYAACMFFELYKEDNGQVLSDRQKENVHQQIFTYSSRTASQLGVDWED